MDLVPDSDFVIRLIPLPRRVNGFVAYDSDARANIYINSELDISAQMEAVRHELDHVFRCDAYGDASIFSIEQEAL